MTTLREAVAQALDALTKIHPANMSWETGDVWMNAVQILREALAQPEPEPVAWMDRDGEVYKMPEIEGWAPPHTLLYTAPPQCKPLTEEETYSVLRNIDPETKRLPPGLKALVQEIEAAHGIGEKG